MELAGYRSEDLFSAETGRLNERLEAYLRKHVGDRVTDQLQRLALQHQRGQFAQGPRGTEELLSTLMAARGVRKSPEAQRMVREIEQAVNADFERLVSQRPEGAAWVQKRRALRAVRQRIIEELENPLRTVMGTETSPAAALGILQNSARAGGDIRVLQAFLRVAEAKGDRSAAASLVLQGMAEGGLTGFLRNWRSLSPEARQLLFQGPMAPLGAQLERLVAAGSTIEGVASRGGRMRAAPQIRQAITAALWGWVHLPSVLTLGVGAKAADMVLASRGFARWLQRMPPTLSHRGWEQKLSEARGFLGEAYGVNEQVGQAAANLMQQTLGIGGARAQVQPVMFLDERSPLADRQSLVRARQMKRENKDRDTIWRETGWWEQTPGRWVFEIDDSGFKAIKPVTKPGRFFDHFSHPHMPAGNPRLKNLRVYPYSNKSTMGEFTPELGVGIERSRPYGDDSYRDTGVHELQHAEDATAGLHPDNSLQNMQRHKFIDMMSKRLNMPADQRRQVPPWYDPPQPTPPTPVPEPPRIARPRRRRREDADIPPAPPELVEAAEAERRIYEVIRRARELGLPVTASRQEAINFLWEKTPSEENAELIDSILPRGGFRAPWEGVLTGQARVFGGAEAAAPPPGQEELDVSAGRPGRVDEVWRQHGWMRDPEGVARFEIDDSEATITEQGINLLESGRGALRLDQFISHPELLRQFPGSAGLRVRLGGGLGEALGRYDPLSKTIVLNMEQVTDEETALRTVLHEWQHWERSNRGRRASTHRPYDDRVEEDEARLVEERIGMTAEERRRTSPEFSHRSYEPRLGPERNGVRSYGKGSVQQIPEREALGQHNLLSRTVEAIGGGRPSFERFQETQRTGRLSEMGFSEGLEAPMFRGGVRGPKGKLGRNLTEEEISTIVARRRRGSSLRDIAEDYDLTHPTIRRVLREAGLDTSEVGHFARQNMEEGARRGRERGLAYVSVPLERVAELQARGMGATAIARELGSTPGAVWRALQRLERGHGGALRVEREMAEGAPYPAQNATRQARSRTTRWRRRKPLEQVED